MDVATTFLDSLMGCFHRISLSDGLILSLFTAGLVSGFTHCSFMCGSFVTAQSMQADSLRRALLIPYHLGRMTTYVLMAVALSSVLNTAFLYLPIRGYIIAPILMLAATVFLVVAFPSAGRLFPWAGRMRVGLPLRFMNKMMGYLSSDMSVVKRYGMGILLGFMPCGMIVAALLAASSASTVGGAALAMLSFGLGTVPALVLVSLGGRVIRSRYPVFAGRAKQVMMILSALWLFAMAGTMISF